MAQTKKTEEEIKQITAQKYEYRKANYVQKSLRVKKDEREAYRAASDAAGMSLNSWMIEACKKLASEG